MGLFNKKRKKNVQNSSMKVTCIATEKCKFRYTTLCDKCKHNIGAEGDKSYFEPKML